ncbi:sporulation protein YqfD [Clostridium formicaceticum]|uniref:Sporulation protein YqfD n=1 Tax=Clostridium formicaceticum TaxID=1497 RepID=A0AAC9RNE1_9CLOT|nr:sporulation protein YqfD [Clostridium formicaceticum]AOY77555.1 sporulation protein YqfD [Clostridium formicaceticum]ARE88133.1 Putative stage IV sporulation protein YqfD [Clostridium formicaceticum]
MLILKLWNYLRGYVIIKIEGLALERFINMCIAREIYLWDIQRINYTTLEAKIGIKAFKTLRKLARRAGCKVYISEKNGYPFWFSKVKKRKMLILGAFFSLILLLVVSSFVLIIDVTGNENVSKAEILTVLEEIGFKPGVNRYAIDLREIENNALINIHELAWIGIEINGIHAKIEVVEKTPPPPKIDKNIPCDVIARKSGVIEQVIARNGDAVVEKGDIVSSGDLLITGLIEREVMEAPIYLHAYGEVYARTYYEVEKSVPLMKINKEKTGEKYTRRIIKLGELELALSKGDHPYKVYIIEKTSKKPIQWRDKGIPVEIITEEIYEAIEVTEKVDVEAAKNTLHETLVEELVEQIPKDLKILSSNTEFTVENNTLYGNLIIEVLEEIGEQKKLHIEED